MFTSERSICFMVISFKSLARPRRASKALRERIPGMKLSEAQAVIARMCGYDGWAQLKQATERTDALASPDDEDLGVAELKQRLEFQVKQVRTVVSASVQQAREIVRLTSPTARNPAPPEASPTREPPLRGTNVYMPSLFTRFGPSYPELFGFLIDVEHLRVDFIQPDEHSLSDPHLASSVTFTFSHGKKLTLAGVYLWKFLDDTPPELLDEQGDYLQPNPYSPEPVEQMLRRLRIAYRCLFTDSAPLTLTEPAPVWVELDMAQGTLTRRNPIALQASTKDLMWHIFDRVVAESASALQPAVDQFMVASLTGPRVELRLVSKGGRGSNVFGNEYVPSSWAGTGHWTMRDLMMELSPEPLHPSGCGGNCHYHALFDQALSTQFAAALLVTCQEVLAQPDLYAAMRSQLELPLLKGRVTAGARAKQLVDGLLATNMRLDLASAFSGALVRRQGDRTFSSWLATLAVDPSRVRPTVRIEETIKQFREKP